MRPRSLTGILAGVLLGAGLVVLALTWLPNALDGSADPGRADDAAADEVAHALAEPAPAHLPGNPAAGGAPSPTPAPPATSAPTPEPTPEPTPTAELVVADKPVLRARLASLLADPRLESAEVALHVMDELEREVFDHDADRPLLPASTVKLVTAAAALADLGPAYRFTTTVHATNQPGPDGVLHGDLVLVGGADPALATPQFGEKVNSQRPRTPMESLADQLHAAGVRHVTGRVLGDPSVLPDEPLAAGWLDRYLARGDAMRSSGLTVDGGRRLFVTNGELQSAPAEDPASEAAASLTALLTDREVTVAGPPGATSQPPPAPHLLATVESPPMLELLTHTVQRSDNHLADTIFRVLGEARGDGTWVGSAQAVQRSLAPLRLDWDLATLADGSGLSRDDRLTARFLTTLDARMHASNRGQQWREVMAVSGRSGTLRHRLRGSVAEGRLAGKTGTLNDTRSLAATVEGPDGTRYHFAVVANGLAGDAITAARELQDEIALALAEDLYGCERIVVERATPEASEDVEGEPQSVLECAA